MSEIFVFEDQGNLSTAAGVACDERPMSVGSRPVSDRPGVIDSRVITFVFYCLLLLCAKFREKSKFDD